MNLSALKNTMLSCMKSPLLIFGVCGAVSLLAVVTSLFAEFAWKIQPCRLCHVERGIYLGILILCGVMFWKGMSSTFRWLRWLLPCAILLLMSVSVYHFGVQAGLVKDPCGVPKNIATLDDFQKMLDSPIPCAKASWVVFGVPVTVWNCFVSAVMFGWCYIGFNRSLQSDRRNLSNLHNKHKKRVR